MRVDTKLQKQRPTRMQLLTLATSVGTIAAVLAYFVLARQTQGAQRVKPQIQTLVTAAFALPPRTALTNSMLTTTPRGVQSCPPGAFASVSAVVGQVTRMAIAKGHAVTTAEVTTRAALQGLSPQIAPNQRAICIPLGADGGVAGFLEPGDHVDILATFNTSGGQSVARLIVPNALLLALGGASTARSGPAQTASSAMLEVSPRAAEAVALAANHGQLTLALRGLGDDMDSALPPLPSDEVTGIMPPAAPRAKEENSPPVAQIAPLPPLIAQASAPPPLPQVIVIRGMQKTTVTVGQ